MRDHRDLEVWKKAHLLQVEIYRATATFPSSERYELVRQMRRAAVSITSNIAEGAARRSDKEFLRYLDIAMGSAGELLSQVQGAVATRMGPTPVTQPLLVQVIEVRRMLGGLMRGVRRRLA